MTNLKMNIGKVSGGTNKALGWDVDRTLVSHTAGALHLRCFDYALRNVLGIKTDVRKDIDYAGKTDRRILIEASRKYGKKGEFYRRGQEIIEILCLEFEKQIKDCPIELMPGAEEALEYLSKQSGVLNGLVTGNSERVAKAKVRKLGIEDYFIFGGYGDRFENRSYVVKQAVSEAERHAREKLGWGSLEVYIIDDTPRGIKAAMEGGAKGIGVMSGADKDPSSFMLYKPVIVIESLKEIDKLKTIFLPMGG